MKNRQPWGRGGGGAPLRDSTGNLIGMSPGRVPVVVVVVVVIHSLFLSRS